jgi:hypothetical protein
MDDGARPVPGQRSGQAAFTVDSTIRQVVEGTAVGRRLLFEHGYDVGNGFVDTLSQYQSLRDAARSGRLRDLTGLLETLNRA